MKIHFNKRLMTGRELFFVTKARFSLSQPDQVPITCVHQFNKTRLMLGSLATAATLVFLLCLFFNPRWQTNDDVAMSMIAHGYGLAATGSPNLVFSNVLWGYLVRVIPEINGVLGYSIATLSVLVIFGAVVIYGLYKLGLSYVVSFSVLALILVRAVLFPQFTVNSGLLMIGSIICWHLYAQQNDRRTLVVGSLLAFFSFLIRHEEFLLVFFVALPTLPWRTLLLSRAFRTAFLAVIVAIAASVTLDHNAYQRSEWKTFNEFRPAVSPIVNFSVRDYLIKRPDILERHGYSANDVDLLKGWFFEDPKIANPNALRAMNTELGPLPWMAKALVNAWAGVQTLWHPTLLPLTLTATFLFILHPSWKVAASWMLCIAAFLMLGLLGRPNTLRVCLPLASFLVLAPFLEANFTAWCKYLGASVLLVACLINTFLVFSESKATQIAADNTRTALAGFPNESVVIWGAALPFESVYPVLGASFAAMHYKLYSLASFTLAPFSVSFSEQKAGRGMIELLVSGKGVPIVASKGSFRTLDIYCRQHFHGQLRELSAQKYGKIMVSRRRCEVES